MSRTCVAGKKYEIWEEMRLMDKYESKVTTRQRPAPMPAVEAEEHLNFVANDGWRLVNVITIGQSVPQFVWERRRRNNGPSRSGVGHLHVVRMTRKGW